MFRPESQDDPYAEREQKRCASREQPERVISYSTPSEGRWPLPERWEVERERMYNDGDSNEEIFDRYVEGPGF